ncbi:MAG: hypothetical protein WA775_06365 [Psychroserpens sp.]|uniref:hypothetical protein n=1 Tax=Psychroserpens sp. TaxID=2020870 RepID=UPI003C7533FC
MKRLIIFTILVLLQRLEATAQCAMCRAVLESEEGQVTGQGINDGIMYLMTIPYLLVGGIGFAIYWKFFRRKKRIQ